MNTGVPPPCLAFPEACMQVLLLFLCGHVRSAFMPGKPEFKSPKSIQFAKLAVCHLNADCFVIDKLYAQSIARWLLV